MKRTGARLRQAQAARQARQYEQRRGSARERGYTAAWDSASAAFILQHPLCRYCREWGHVRPAELTDHLYPQRWHPELMWERLYWIPSCRSCHDGYKQAIEREGEAAIDAIARTFGLPTLREWSKGRRPLE